MGAYVYALIDPRDESVRYVGSCNDIKSRIGGHLRNRDKFLPGNPKKLWMADLLASGLTPKVVILEEHRHVEDGNEKWWIAYFLRNGEPLTNSYYVNPGCNDFVDYDDCFHTGITRFYLDRIQHA